MKVKKYVAPTMPEVMNLIRTELGNEAVILNSKVVQSKGVLGFFRKKNFEVIAALDHIEPHAAPKEVLSPKTYNGQRKAEDPIRTKDFVNEIMEMKAMLNQIQTKTNTNLNLPKPIQQLHYLMNEKELESDITESLISSLLSYWYKNKEQVEQKELLEYLKDLLLKKISPIGMGGIDYQKKYVTVVGPTGVGKTTTLAKMAAEAILKDKKKVAFITTDTYRIAAIEQLKTYAKILDVPIEVSYNIEDFRKAKEKFEDFDLVFIDTAGRNFRKQQYVNDLKQIIDFNDDVERYLVLGVTSKYIDMMNIYHQFSIIKISKVIFSKVDETGNHGQMVNFMLKNNIGAAYITTGQNVPDDISEATPEMIINILFGEGL
ncbi:flagellar biosynthesis protein FlhF [Litchfieldia alkalitelluris]|uniref:flagellar biosynthesis protein FlhF n=1 Tax=Litchfieldia alkalitelluris TaxID=304268 RepID=UPI00099777DD|nr:flagellar biosynthesis protein FlhF [Litchfieldia alkalitelluris]